MKENIDEQIFRLQRTAGQTKFIQSGNKNNVPPDL